MHQFKPKSKNLFLLFTMIINSFVYGQNSIIDSLSNVIENHSPTTPIDSFYAQIQYNLAMEYFKEENYSQATKYGESAKIFAPKRTILDYYVTNSLGDFYLKESDFVKSLTSFTEALEISSILKDPAKTGMVHYNLHIHYDFTSNKELSEHHLNKAYDLIKETTDTIKTIRLLNSLAGVNITNNKLQKSKSQFEESLQLAKKYNDSNLISMCYTNFADYFFNTSDTGKALELLNLSYLIDKEVGSSQDKVIAAYNIATIFKSKNKYDSSEVYYLEAYEHAKNANHLVYLKILNKTLFNLYYEMNRVDSLPIIFERYRTITDSIYSKNELDKYAEAQNEMELLQKENELKIANVIQQENRQRLLILSLLISIIIIVLIGLFIARNDLNSKNQEVNKLLLKTQKQKAKIHKQKDELQNSNKILQQNAIAKDRIMSLLAHDLRTPLSSIQSLNQLIVNAGEANPKQLKFIDTSNKIALDGLELISDILDIYKLDNMDDFDIELINISALLNNSIQKSTPNALVKNQVIKASFDSNMEFLTNREMLQSVVDNLISNAIKYSDKNKSVKIDASIINNNLTISITDEGEGFSLEEQKTIFNRFNSFSRSKITTETSTGLGLFLVKGFVEKLNGTITVNSLKNEGTTFTLVFQSTNQQST